jgi:7-cyano-7-deazaguanine synthase
MTKQAVLSLSGGMDSSTLLIHLLSAGYKVTALSFDYGQKHRVELERAQQLVHYINSQAEHEDEHYFTKVKHQIITLSGLSELLNSALVTGGKDVPEGHYEQDNMKATVVPNRNKIFSSIIQAVALSIATQKDEKRDVVIALGIHAGDFSVYPDCREEFRNADYEAFRIGNWDSELVTYTTPYIDVTKFEILEDGLDCCKQLGLNFDEVYCRTNTSYKPIQFQTPVGPKWYSDYKSAASVERIEAFIKLGRPDPVLYANEEGPVNWETARDHVKEVLAAYGK